MSISEIMNLMFSVLEHIGLMSIMRAFIIAVVAVAIFRFLVMRSS